jgi:carboxynorspermidine decarboxylase
MSKVVVPADSSMGTVVDAKVSELPGGVDVGLFPTPCFVVNLGKLRENLGILGGVQQASGAKILLALKGFAFFPAAKIIMGTLKGTTSSGLHELLLGSSEFGGESHVYCPAYDPRDFDEICNRADHLVFNTPQQWQRFGKQVIKAGKHAAIRVNPEYSELEVPMYDPCYAHSRLGTTKAQFDPQLLDGVTTLHFHTMCEQNSDTLERTLDRVEAHFGEFIKTRCQAVNFGGGHHITRSDYDLETLTRCIRRISDKYGVSVYLEPGEAVALGLKVMLQLSVIKMNFDESTAARIINFIDKHYETPVWLSSLHSEMMNAVVQDKKNTNQQIRMVLLKAIGQPEYDVPCTLRELENVLNI